jgi:adenosylhomocysteinase
MDAAAAYGDIFVTTTGNVDVIGERHFHRMKDGAILANAGHFNVEIDLERLCELAGSIEQREGVETFTLEGRRIHVLAEGRLVNLATPKGMGHPIEVMDLSFALQALSAEYIVRRGHDLPGGVYDVPAAIDEAVAREKLSALGIAIDDLTEKQARYLSAWDVGT